MLCVVFVYAFRVFVNIWSKAVGIYFSFCVYASFCVFFGCFVQFVFRVLESLFTPWYTISYEKYVLKGPTRSCRHKRANSAITIALNHRKWSFLRPHIRFVVESVQKVIIRIALPDRATIVFVCFMCFWCFLRVLCVLCVLCVFHQLWHNFSITCYRRKTCTVHVPI